MIVLSKFSEGLENRRGALLYRGFESLSFLQNNNLRENVSELGFGANGTKSAQRPTESTQKGPHSNRQMRAFEVVP